MWSTLKAIPVVPKILLGSLVFMLLVGMSRRHHTQPMIDDENYSASVPQQTAFRGQSERNPVANEQVSGAVASEAAAAQQQLAQFVQEHAALAEKAQACMMASNEAARQTNEGMMRGQWVSNQPPCLQFMPQWQMRISFLETEIYRYQSGDHTTDMRHVLGIAAPEASGGTGYYRPSGPGNDGGISAVDRTTREGIRGNSLYDDPDGTQHELATQPYYYRNANSGEIVSSDQSTAPNDGRPWEAMTPQEY